MDAPRSEFRRELQSEFKFAPAAKDSRTPEAGPASQGTSRTESPPAAGADIVTMPRFEVHSTRNMTGLAIEMAQDKPKTESEKAQSTLGIGVHAIKLGKVTLYARTILYIPFLVGIEW
jgi:hypothetical protein